MLHLSKQAVQQLRRLLKEQTPAERKTLVQNLQRLRTFLCSHSEMKPQFTWDEGVYAAGHWPDEQFKRMFNYLRDVRSHVVTVSADGETGFYWQCLRNPQRVTHRGEVWYEGQMAMNGGLIYHDYSKTWGLHT